MIVVWITYAEVIKEYGNVVITEHYGWKNNIPAVFDNLHKLNKGDIIYIEDKSGRLPILLCVKFEHTAKMRSRQIYLDQTMVKRTLISSLTWALGIKPEKLTSIDL